MPIIRSNHSFDSQFARIPNAWLRDPRLSLKSIGLLAQLMSHTPGWNVSIRSLATNNACGLDSIRTAVAELEEAGYLTRSQERTDLGRFGETTWLTTDPTPSPSSVSPSSGFPTTDNPTSDNPTTKKTKIQEDQFEEELENAHSVREVFDEFWSIYPRKAGKGAAWKAFYKAHKALGDPSVILEGARSYRDDPNRVEAFTAHPATWLNGERWEDDPLPERVLTAAELKAKEEADYLARKARDAELREQARLEREREAEEIERNRRENPVDFCVHDRVAVICTKCNPPTPRANSGEGQ